MDITCPKCGATNRNTSRFCARCGEALPDTPQNATHKESGEMNLPWLQAVQERAVHRTGHLRPEHIGEPDDVPEEEATPETSPTPLTPQAEQASAQQNVASEEPVAQEEQPQGANPD